MSPRADDTPIYAQLAAETGIRIDDEPRSTPPARLGHGPGAVEEVPDHLAGHLGTVTDDEWRLAHERLIADMPGLAEQLAYVWDPRLDGRTLVAPHERDMAPRPGRYDPGRDERFHGGGFRG